MTFSKNPKSLFLIDGFGALVSAFLLGIVLVQFESFFGIPKNTLYFLAFLPCLFFIFNLMAYRKAPAKLGKNLKTIALINLFYCGLSIALAFYHFQQITIFGWGYIIGEIAIVVGLAIIELRTAAALK